MTENISLASNIAEVSLIGTGGGYGESCVVHLGNGNWIVVDSCINPETKHPLPLEYLESIGVDVKESVKLILCTHWHDDHIKGISTILNKSENAIFSMARTNDKKKFLQMVGLDYQKLKKVGTNASTQELNKCLEIVRARSLSIKESSLDKTLFAINYSDTVRSEVIALSPSDYTVEEFDREISTLIDNYGETNKRIPIKSPNAKSVVVFLKLGTHRAILGSDLEVSLDSREGWLNIIENSMTVDKKSNLFKIPHHGSENAYHDEVWNKLLISNPVAKLTPWNRKNKLPTPEMVDRYSNKTDKLFITSVFSTLKPKKRDKSIERIIKDFNLKISEIPYHKGIIQCRIPMDSEEAEWDVKLIDSATRI